MSAEEKSSHWLSFVLLLALCAPKILGTNDVSGMVHGPVVSEQSDIL